jgi:putative ABC transport system permease protein
MNSGLPDDTDPFNYEFTNIRDIHLNTEVEWELRSDPQYSYILGGIGLLILIIACINYISLSLSTSVSRQTEVGVRKAIGAHQKQLFFQFTVESILLAGLSMLIGLVMVVLFLPYFNDFTNKNIALDLPLFAQVFMMSILISIVVGFLSGVYPAIFLSSYRPVRVLKSNKTSRLKAGFTVPLVLIQFCLSAMLIICSLIMFRQMKFITTKDLGYNADQIIVIPTQMGFSEESDRVVAKFRQAISGEPEFSGVAGTTMSFNRGWSRYGYTIDEEEKFAYVYGVDYEYLPLLDIEFVEGRNFDQNNPADSNAIIVNEALVKDMGWKTPLQEYLNWQEDSLGRGDRIIGVARDYHFLSLENDIHPMFLSINTNRIGHLTEIMVKLQAGNIPEGIEKLRDKWREIMPDKPFTYTFLDDNVASQYESYERWMKIMGLATFFAIVISCLGLFGLSGINAVNRTKEIGIRKVMGAETWNIFILLNKQFVWLALGSFVVAAPVSWYIMDQWLESFQFVIPMSWDIFAISIGIGLAVAILTVSYHSLRAANKNPADTLKYE